MSFHRFPPAGLLVALALGLAVSAPTLRARAAIPQNETAAREAAYRENNLGVALLEQFRFADAVSAFERAVATDPTLGLARVNLVIAHLYVPDHDAARREAEAALEALPDSLHLNYILGLVARAEGRAEDAIPYLKKVLEEDPKDLGANLTLGQSYLQLRRFEDAVEVFQVAAAAEPYNVSAAYNLGVALNRAGKREEAREALQAFQVLRDSAYKTSLGSAYLEQGKYAEALASTGAEAGSVDEATPRVSFVEEVPPLVGEGTRTGTSVTGALRASVVLGDLDGDGALDLVEGGSQGLRILQNEGGRFRDVTGRTGLAGVPAVAALVGDYDNDEHPDLLVLRQGGLSLYRNDGDGAFEDRTEGAGFPAWPHGAGTAAFVDIDHDGDLDVFVGGLSQGADDQDPAPSLLLQNDGQGAFTDVTESSGLGAASRSLAVIPTDFDNRRDVDLFVLRDGRPALFKNMRDGSFRDVAAELGLVAPGDVQSVAGGDTNKDGFIDFVLGGSGPSWIALSDGRGAFRVRELPPAAADVQAVQLTDYDKDGLQDLLLVTGKGPRLLRNLGERWVDVSQAAFPGAQGSADLQGAALGVADLDADGDQDAVLVAHQGLRLLSNEGGNRNHSFAVDLAGRVSNKGGVGAKVEVRAGALRQKIETSAAVPMAAPADVVFGLGARRAPDAVRVIWVSGIVQTETEMGEAPEAGKRAALGILEIDRKPSSCPFLYAWDGERFTFVTDFLGGGEMGYGLAPGVWNHPDPVEYVRIGPDGLRPRDGRYEIRVTNELEEVLFVDELRLLAVDHPGDVLVYPDEGMTSPPKEHRLHAVRDPRVPRATDHAGRDVTDRAAHLDRRFIDRLPLERIRGYAKLHTLTLDLTDLPESHTTLLLTGWTDYAFSSDNVAAHQAGLALVPPRLEVQRPGGEWETAVGQIGIPVGRPQTVVVDLATLGLSAERQVRITTSMRVYWDHVRVAAPVTDEALEPVVVPRLGADLRERGFSAETSPDGREPWSYDYARVSWLSPWKTMAGRYTRLGDVSPLVTASDDTFVVSKPGDELAMAFDADHLGAPGPGRVRTFLLLGVGYSKEMDINSASPDAVAPLPWRQMSAYPYPADEVPDAVHRAWEEMEPWRTRKVVRPLFPLDLYAAGDDVHSSRAGTDD